MAVAVVADADADVDVDVDVGDALEGPSGDCTLSALSERMAAQSRA
jgi:hypothetical protein